MLNIIAIRIYNSNNTVMADLKTADGVTETIEWINAKERSKFSKYINGYTFIYDERKKPGWDEVRWTR